MKIRVHEIFNSVSGEVGVIPQGAWTTFIRLAGCNLRCSWCDTVRAQQPEDGEEMAVEELLQRTDLLTNVLITGGEPLLQMEAVTSLVNRLWPDHSVQIETNGSLLPTDFLSRHTCLVFDRKLGSSGMADRMLPLEALEVLPSRTEGAHWLKMVVTSEQDYEEAVKVCRSPTGGLHLALSAAPPGLTHDRLFQLMRRDGLTDVRLSVQIHKLAGLGEGLPA